MENVGPTEQAVTDERQRQTDKHWLVGSLTGTLLVAVCCFTPLLVLLLTAAGLGALTGYLDRILLPLLALFLLLAAWSFARYRKTHGTGTREG